MLQKLTVFQHNASVLTYLFFKPHSICYNLWHSPRINTSH